MHKLSVEAPPKILVERYLIEIAKNYNVPYEPDAMVRVSIIHYGISYHSQSRMKSYIVFIHPSSNISVDSPRYVLERRRT